MTFSIIGRCERTGAVGAAVTSSSPAVAARCSYVRAGVGAAMTQNVTDPRLGPALLDALAAGGSAGDALASVCKNAAHLQHRQLTVVDSHGGSATFTGELSLGVHGALHGEGCAVAGNLLAGETVLHEAMAAFGADPSLALEERLLASLRAGLAAGGEAGPLRSAGLLAVEDTAWPSTDLRVDWHDEPIAELRGLWELWAPQKADYVRRAMQPDRAPGYGVPGDDR